MNIDTLSHSWEGFLPEHLERTISVAASISVWATNSKFAVGLLANGSLLGSDRPLRLPPSRSKVQIIKILESNKPSISFYLLKELNFLKLIFPELDIMSGVDIIDNRVSMVSTSAETTFKDLGTVPIQAIGEHFKQEPITT